MKLLTSFLVAASLLVPASGISAATFFTENFDETMPTSAQGDAVGNFSIPAAYPNNLVAVFGTIGNGGGTFNSCFAPESGNCINLAGLYDSAQIVSTNALSLAPGTYTLSFHYGGSNQPGDSTDSGTVSLGSLFSKSFSISSTGTPQLFSNTFTVSAAQSAYLTFTDTTPRPGSGSFDGPMLDNINVASAGGPPPASTPEPASVALLGSGLLVLALKGVRAARRERPALSAL